MWLILLTLFHRISLLGLTNVLSSVECVQSLRMMKLINVLAVC